MASKKIYIDDIGERVCELNHMEIKDDDHWREALIEAFARLMTSHIRLSQLVEQGILEQK
jgi:hypothetical protein